MNERDRQQIEDVRVSLYDHFNALMAEQDKRIEQSFQASREAHLAAQAANERRLELLNEFRAQSRDEGQRYATNERLNSEAKTRDTRFEVMEAAVHKLERNISRIYGGFAVFAFIGIAALVRVFWTG